jgi:hypothetical protein
VREVGVEHLTRMHNKPLECDARKAVRALSGTVNATIELISPSTELQ